MSQQNVDLCRRMVEAVNDQDETRLAVLLDRSYRIENIVTAITDKTYFDVAGCVAWWQDMSEAFAPGARYELEAVIADSDDFVVKRMAFVGTGAKSGAPLELRWIAVTWFNDGKMTRSAGYANRHEALKAAGLED